MSLWPSATKKHPCEVCGKDTWCSFGDRAILCQREPSDFPFDRGGWFHPYNGERRKQFNPPKKSIVEPIKNFDQVLEFWEASTSCLRLELFANLLGVKFEALNWLDCSQYVPRNSYNQAWAFPMRDGMGNCVGIRLRDEQGNKWAVKGSRQGLFIPSYLEGNDDGTCFITEGPTDCAAALSLGFYSIGRPSCNSNPEQILIALREHKILRVVIVADNDTKFRMSGEEWSPGAEGAKQLAKVLRKPYVIFMPPGCKDFRQFVNKGGTAQLVNSLIGKMIWQR